MWRLLRPAALASLFLLPAHALAAEAIIQVNTVLEAVAADGLCSVREAIQAANLGAAHDACVLEGSGAPVVLLGEGVHLLTKGALSITRPMTVRGAGARLTTLLGNGTSGLIGITGNPVPVVIEHLRLTGSGGDYPTAAIYAANGELVVSDAIIENNATSGIRSRASRTLVRRTLVHGNATPGLEFMGFGTFNTVVVESSTVSGHLGPGPATAIQTSSATVLRQVTLSNNAGESGVVVTSSLAALTFDGVLMRDNTGTATFSVSVASAPFRINNSAFLDHGRRLWGEVTTSGVNLFEAEERPSFAGPDDLVVAPGGPDLLRAWGDYGGPAPVHAVKGGAPLIGRSSCLGVDGVPYGVDQRGAPRPETGCTIGPVEYGAFGLATRVELAADEACPHGGFLEFSGEDNGHGGMAQDGLLSDGEIENTRLTCNRPGVLIELSEEPPGAHCEAGGQRIDTGLDLDASGVLEAGEIETTRYLCHEPPLIPTLFEVVDFTRSLDCPVGGRRLLTGRDTNRNGVLDPGELTSTLETCHGTDGADGEDARDGTGGDSGRDGRPGAPGRDGDDARPGRDGRDGDDASSGCAAAGASSLALLALQRRRSR